MVALTEEMKQAFSTMKAFPVATSSKNGWPNVVPVGFVELVSDDTIWIADNFMRKTLSNIQENPKISISIWGPETKGCFQIKGEVEIRSSGPEFEKMQETVRSKMAQAPAKNLLIVTIREVYSCTPGKNAGDKLL